MLAGLALAAAPLASAQAGNMGLPQSVTAGSAFSIPTTGSGKAVLYIAGPGQALRRDVQLGEAVSFPAGVLYNAGRYTAILLAGILERRPREFEVTPAAQPETLSFLAKPSRLPVGLHNGISGTVYVFDAYHNLITTPMPVSFELSNSSGTVQARTVTTRNGVAWTEMDSAAKEGTAKFLARADGVSSTRVIDEVPGDPCGLTMSAQPDGRKLELRDGAGARLQRESCSGRNDCDIHRNLQRYAIHGRRSSQAGSRARGDAGLRRSKNLGGKRSCGGK